MKACVDATLTLLDRARSMQSSGTAPGGTPGDSLRPGEFSKTYDWVMSAELSSFANYSIGRNIGATVFTGGALLRDRP